MMICANVFAQSENDELNEIIVWGRESDLIGLTDSASEGIIGKEGFKFKNIKK